MKPNVKQLKRSQKLLGVKLKSKDPVKAAEELQAWVNENFEEDDLSLCNQCSYVVPDNDLNGVVLETCIYCGAEFEVDDEEEDDEEEDVDVVNSISSEDFEEEDEESDDDEEETEDEEEEFEEDSDDEEDESEDEEESDLEVDEEYEVEDVVDSEDEEVEEDTEEVETEEVEEVVEEETKEEEVQEPKVKKTPAKKKGKDKTKVAKKKGAKNTLAKVEEDVTALSKDQEKELDRSIKRVSKLKENYVTNTYDLGEELKKIADGLLWKARYKSFTKFCENELDIEKGHAHRLMRAVEKFTREEFVSLGIKKADFIGRLPDTKRDDVIKQVVDKEMSYTELEKFVKEEVCPAPVQTEPKERKEEKEQVKKETKKTDTILAKVVGGDVEIEWKSSKTHKKVKERNEEDKYAILKISEEIELVIMDSDDGLGLICTYRRLA